MPFGCICPNMYHREFVRIYRMTKNMPAVLEHIKVLASENQMTGGLWSYSKTISNPTGNMFLLTLLQSRTNLLLLYKQGTIIVYLLYPPSAASRYWHVAYCCIAIFPSSRVSYFYHIKIFLRAVQCFLLVLSLTKYCLPPRSLLNVFKFAKCT